MGTGVIGAQQYAVIHWNLIGKIGVGSGKPKTYRCVHEVLIDAPGHPLQSGDCFSYACTESSAWSTAADIKVSSAESKLFIVTFVQSELQALKHDE